jgi:hypothetical protein
MKEEIIRMVWQVVRSDASSLLGCDVDDLVRFATLAYAAGAAAEREACAKVCEKFGYDNHHGIITDQIATAIRARGQA